MLEAGSAGARTLIARGGYTLFVEAGRSSAPNGAQDVLRNTQASLQLTRFLYDFVDVEASLVAKDRELRIDYRNVASFSDAMFLGTCGFVEEMGAIIAGRSEPDPSAQWEAERFDDGSFRFSMSAERLLVGGASTDA